VGTTGLAQTAPSKPDTLPTLLRQRDLALLVVLVTIIASDVRGMQFAETAIFFYWFLALATFQLPSLWVFGWLMRQAPRHVPLYVWILRLVPECWRSILLFLIWWAGILIALAVLGMCLPWLSAIFPPWFSAFPVQCLVFAILLLLATLLTALPLRLFRLVLWTGGLCYLGAFVFATVVTLLTLFSGRTSPGLVLRPAFTALPTHFSWSLFGLSLLCLFGLNEPLLLDGEMQGAQRFLRGSTSSLWWGGLSAFLFLLGMTVAWIILDPTLHVMYTPLLQVIHPLLGSQAWSLHRLLLFLGTFGCVLAYLFVFARAFLLAAHLGYLPRSDRAFSVEDTIPSDSDSISVDSLHGGDRVHRGTRAASRRATGACSKRVGHGRPIQLIHVDSWLALVRVNRLDVRVCLLAVLEKTPAWPGKPGSLSGTVGPVSFWHIDLAHLRLCAFAAGLASTVFFPHPLVPTGVVRYRQFAAAGLDDL
jgi:hypothetical protein